MLQALDVSRAGLPVDVQTMTRAEMVGPKYEQYWAHVNHIGTAGDDLQETARRAVEELQKIHIDMDEVTAQQHVCRSVKSATKRSIRPSELFPGYKRAAFAVDRDAQVAAVEAKIKDLEWRLELAKENPPQVDPGEFEAFRDRIKAKFDGSVTRKTSRAMWRRNRKIAEAALKNEERRKGLEIEWRAGTLELEATLHKFKARLQALTASGESSVDGLLLEAKQLRLDAEAATIKKERIELQAVLDARAEKARAERAGRRAREVEMKDGARRKAGHMRIVWDGDVAATMRLDRKAAEKGAVEGSVEDGRGMLEDGLRAAREERKIEPARKVLGRGHEQPKSNKRVMEYSKMKDAKSQGEDDARTFEPAARDAQSPRSVVQSMQYNEPMVRRLYAKTIHELLSLSLQFLNMSIPSSRTWYLRGEI
jgi:hypothetical protein